MHHKILFLILLFPLLALSQTKPHFKRTITAYEINKKDTIKKNVLVTYLDSLKAVITSEDNISNAIAGNTSTKDKTYSVDLVDTDQLYISATVNQKGDTLNKIVYKFNDQKQQTEYYQIHHGDTLNGQKRVYDAKGNNTQLLNRIKETGVYFLRMEWEYDLKNNSTQTKTYNEAGQLIGLDKYANVYKNDEVIVTKSSYNNAKGYVKQYKEIIKGPHTTTYYYYSGTGFNYGITISHVAGGMRVEEKDADGNLKVLKYFDDKKHLTVLVVQEETKI